MYEQETREIMELKNSWLRASNMTEQQLVLYKTVDDFNLSFLSQEKYAVIKLQFKKGDVYAQIGENIVFLANDANAKLNAALLILSIMQTLDKANEMAPEFDRKNRDRCLRLKLVYIASLLNFLILIIWMQVTMSRTESF